MRKIKAKGSKPAPVSPLRQAMEKTSMLDTVVCGEQRLLPWCQKLVIPVNYSGKAFSQLLL